MARVLVPAAARKARGLDRKLWPIVGELVMWLVADIIVMSMPPESRLYHAVMFGVLLFILHDLIKL